MTTSKKPFRTYYVTECLDRTPKLKTVKSAKIANAQMFNDDVDAWETVKATTAKNALKNFYRTQDRRNARGDL